MTYNYRTKGVCSKEMHIELNDDHTIKSVEVIGGCNGNLQAIPKLVEGLTREFDTLKFKKVPQSLETGLFFCQIFIFII